MDSQNPNQRILLYFVRTIREHRVLFVDIHLSSVNKFLEEHNLFRQGHIEIVQLDMEQKAMIAKYDSSLRLKS